MSNTILPRTCDRPCAGEITNEDRFRSETEAHGVGIFAEGSESFAYDLFIDERAVHFGSVEESDTALDSGADKLDRFALLRGGAKTEAQPIQPRPSAETSRPLFPNVRFCMISPITTQSFDASELLYFNAL
jgi:hypothetical protein